MDDLDWIIILFFIYLDDFRVEKIGGMNYRVILTIGPSLENWGLKLSEAILRHRTTFFGVKTFLYLAKTS